MMDIAEENRYLTEKYKLEKETGYDRYIVADGLPIVVEAKASKFKDLLRKIFGKDDVAENGIIMPMEGSEGSRQSKGYVFIQSFARSSAILSRASLAFLQFRTAEAAKHAIQVGSGHRIDKDHVMAVNGFSDIAASQDIPDQFVAPAQESTPLVSEKADYLPHI